MGNREKITVITSKLGLGEGPHWNPHSKILYFVDLYKSEVHSYNPQINEHHHAKVGKFRRNQNQNY